MAHNCFVFVVPRYPSTQVACSNKTCKFTKLKTGPTQRPPFGVQMSRVPTPEEALRSLFGTYRLRHPISVREVALVITTY